MSAQPDPSGELTARVVLGTSRVVLKVPSEPALSFDEPTLTQLFQTGLLLGRGSHRDAVPVGELRAKGDVAFLVGRRDIGMHAGLRAVRDGLVYAIETAVHDLKHPKAATPAPGDETQPPTATPVEDSVAAYRAALGQPPVWPPVTSVEVDDLQSDFDAWLSRVEGGTPITLTRDGRPVAALVASEWYRSQRERLARIESAYWTAWEGGRFDAARFAELVDEQVTPAGELPTKPLPSEDEEDTAAPGAG